MNENDLINKMIKTNKEMKVLSDDTKVTSDYAGDEQKIEQNIVKLKAAKKKFAEILKEAENED